MFLVTVTSEARGTKLARLLRYPVNTIETLRGCSSLLQPERHSNEAEWSLYVFVPFRRLVD